MEKSLKQSLLDAIQLSNESMFGIMEQKLSGNATKADFVDAMKQIYAEANNLTGIGSYKTQPEFIELMQSMSKEEQKQLTDIHLPRTLNIIRKSSLILKIDEKKFLLVLQGLFSLIGLKDEIGNEHIEVFDFFVNSLVNDIFY